ncbi:MAG: bifunctional UDP-N-acetylglucosamine diphosphorylase/glucosamine-1-phosphate N-acetyltransferase GlmU [Alphaproteobacteria bacterium]|nr:bifunctional UDP-N-acetylglucosamine diphosphorylase/glucosamine-1-phosphate N-acetyltransferase GlmU [Alphaproteobacteria bacterium]
MPDTPVAALVLAAGLGTRMRSARPKVMHQLAGRPMVSHLLDTVDTLAPDRVVVVVGPGMDDITAAIAPHSVCVQHERLGTGDAVKSARASLEDFTGPVLIIYGDTPLVSAGTMRAAIAACVGGAAVVVVGFRPASAEHYGRLVTDDGGALIGIVEAKDATEEQLKIGLCNSGMMAISGQHLFDLLDGTDTDNAKGEYYLTDIVAIAHGVGLQTAVVEAEEDELMGINNRGEQASAEAVVQTELRARAMAGGATLVDPSAVWLSHDTVLGRDVTVHPNVVFGPGVTVGDDVEIKSFSHLEGATVAPGAVIGPFARLRPGAEIGAGARVGNFVEVKNAVLEAGAKANHLSYIGDATVGAGANIGAGTITCNYDGFDKHETIIGANAFIGSNTALVAPVTIGDGAIVAAGSTIGRDVAADALAIERAPQEEKPGWATSFRQQRQSAKSKNSEG